VNKETGIKFWTNPKRPPHVITYNAEKEIICSFIHAAANIFAFIYNQPKISMKECMSICNDLNVPKYVPKK